IIERQSIKANKLNLKKYDINNATITVDPEVEKRLLLSLICMYLLFVTVLVRKSLIEPETVTVTKLETAIVTEPKTGTVTGVEITIVTEAETAIVTEAETL
nr:hypothetical protein [Tanacetum cinerariifolium]